MTATVVEISADGTSQIVTVQRTAPATIWVGDFSDQKPILAPLINPLLGQWAWRQGASNPNLDSYPFAAQTLYRQDQLPPGIPPHPSGRYEYAVRMVSNDSDAVNLAEVLPYNVPVHAGWPATALTTAAILGGAKGLTSVFIGFSILFDPSFPQQPENTFFQYAELFGLPWGSPLLYLGVEGPGLGSPRSQTQVMYLDVGQPGLYPWTMPLVRARWFDFVLGLDLFTDPALGGVKLWVNGQPQTFVGAAPPGVAGLGSQQLRYATLKDNVNEQMFYLDNYRAGNWSQGNYVTTWVCGAKVASSYAAAAP